jgi:RNA polymerase sigma-70 factor (ECF subfamily)
MEYSGCTDEQLVKYFLRGDEDAFAEIVRRYSKPLYNLAYRFAGDLSEAYDLTQEVFLRVYKSLPGSRTDLPFKPWIYRIATNLCINWTKKRRKTVLLLHDRDLNQNPVFEQIADQDPLPDELLERKDLQELLNSAISKLPLKYRSVVILRYGQQLSLKEIAEVLGLPMGTVKTHLLRAKAALRKILS